MTREQAREAAKVMLHYADGGEVEYKNKSYIGWYISTNPIFDWMAHNYRIKRTLPEVGKWYNCGTGKMKCIAYEFGKFIFIYSDHKFTMLPDTQNFNHFKEVEP